MSTLQEQNKAVVIRFNRDVIEKGSVDAFNELVAPGCINHTAAHGVPNGRDGMIYFLNDVLRKGISNVQVVIHDQMVDGDKVITRKTIQGKHTGELMGIPATGKDVAINVIDIIRLKDGQYIDHWGAHNIPTVLAELSGE